MLLNTDYIDPAELTGYVRAAAADFPINRFILAQFLPNRLVDDLDYRFLAGGEGLDEAAEYRSYDTEAPIGGRPGIKRVTGEIPPISQKMRLGEYDRLRQRRLADEAITTGLETDAVRLVRRISNRIELARGDALVNASVTLEENGLSVTVDFDRPGECEVTPVHAWSDPVNADPIGDLVTWCQAYLDLNGESPGALVMSTQIIAAMQRTAAFRLLSASLVGEPTLVSRPAIQSALDAFGLPPFIAYDAQVKVDGAAQRIVPSDRVLILPAAVEPDDEFGTQLGGTFWGTTAESLEPSYGLEGNEPGIVAGIYSTEDPVAIWTKAAAISIPVLANPALSFVATVL